MSPLMSDVLPPLAILLRLMLARKVSTADIARVKS